MSYMNNRMSYTLRVPMDVMEAIDALTRERGCSRAEVVIEAMREKIERINHGTANSTTGAGRSEERKTGGSGDGAAVPVLPKAEGKPKRLREVQSLRGELAGRGDEPTQLPESGPASIKSGSCPHGKANAARCRASGGGC